MPAKKKHTTPDKTGEAPVQLPLPSAKEFRHYLRQQACAGIRRFLEEVMEAELATLLGAGWGETTANRTGYRNGYRTRSLLTSSGQVEELRVPRDREGRYQTEVFERYSRYEPELREAMVEMYVAGAGVEKVGKVVETLTGQALSASTVSRLTGDLAEQFSQWQKQELPAYLPILFADAVHYKVRHNERTDQFTVLAVLGVNEAGEKQLVGLASCAEEDKTSWESLFNQLRKRGLTRVEVIVTDGHEGLIAAASTLYASARRQRCVAHKLRNVVSGFPKGLRGQVSEELNSIWEQPDKATAEATLAAFKGKYGKLYPQAIASLSEEEDKTLTFYDLPQSWWRYIRTTNPIETMFSQIRDRTDRVDVFPTEQSCLVLVWATASKIKFQKMKLSPA